MNKERRRELQSARYALELAQVYLNEAKERLEFCRDEEQDYFDSMLANIKCYCNNGGKTQNAIDNMESAIDAIEYLDFDNLFSNIDAAQE